MTVLARTGSGAAAAIALLLAAPSPAAARHDLSAASAAADQSAPLLAVVALTAWLLLGWLALTAALCLLAQLPGAAGHAAAGVVRGVAPGALRRLVAVGLGVTVAVGPVAPALAAPSAAAPAVVSVSLDWPGTGTAELDWPAAPAPPAPPAAPGPDAAPSVPEPAAASQPAGVLGAPVVREAPAGAVVVRPGDTLWGLAESALRGDSARPPTVPQVAAAWPAWWAANRDVIGEDPDLLLPGTVLRPPPGVAPPA